MVQNQIENIKSTILPELEEYDAELIDLELKGRVGSQVLRIYVDTDNGIDLNQCAELSRKISDVLDMKDIIEGRYMLEVSSPGLDRPLRTIRDFRRQIGQKVRIIYNQHERAHTLEGIIEGIDEDQYLKIRGNNDEYRIALTAIRKAKVVLKW